MPGNDEPLECPRHGHADLRVIPDYEREQNLIYCHPCRVKLGYVDWQS